MENENRIKRIIELVKNEISKSDFDFFITNANHSNVDSKLAYGNTLNIDDWSIYFKNHRDKNQMNDKKIKLLFDYLRDFHRGSFSEIDKTKYALNKNFPQSFNFDFEDLIFTTIELFVENIN